MHSVIAHRWFGVLGCPVAIEGSNNCNGEMDVITSKASEGVIDL